MKKILCAAVAAIGVSGICEGMHYDTDEQQHDKTVKQHARSYSTPTTRVEKDIAISKAKNAVSFVHSVSAPPSISTGDYRSPKMEKEGQVVNSITLIINETIQSLIARLSDECMLSPDINKLLSSGNFNDSDFKRDFASLSSINRKSADKSGGSLDSLIKLALNAEETLRSVYYSLIPEYSGNIPDEDFQQLEHLFLERLETIERFNASVK